MTNEERQSIIDAVLSALRTNSVLITDLTEVGTIPEGSFIELSGGRRIGAYTLIQIIAAAVTDESLLPLINAERSERQTADAGLAGRLSTVEGECAGLDANKLDKTDVVESTGESPTKVLSQRYASSLISALQQNQLRIKLEKGTNSNEAYAFVFTNSAGTTATITIEKATATLAGLMSAADKVALDKALDDVEELKNTNIVNVDKVSGSDNLKLMLERAHSSTLEITIPEAGTIPAGEQNPVAGVMSASQAKDLEDVVLQVFPLAASFASSNAGVFEKGVTVTPAATITATRRGVNVLSEATITTIMTVNGNALSYEEVSSNTTLNVSVTHKGSTVALPALRYTFYNYVYGNVLLEAPSDVAAAIAASTTLAELSARTTYEGRLAANRMFLFAVPGNVNLVCRHAETGSVIPSQTGTALVPRRCDNSITDSYSYIIVPASEIQWNFKITNT